MRTGWIQGSQGPSAKRQTEEVNEEEEEAEEERGEDKELRWARITTVRILFSRSGHMYTHAEP